MLSSVSSRVFALPARTFAAPPPAPAPAPSTPATTGDSFKIAAATVAGGALCGGVSALACGIATAVTSLVGIPFVGSGAVTAAVLGSALFGGTLTALTLPKSFAPPAGTQDDFNTSRDGIHKNLPAPKRDAASMVLAENQMWNGLSQARAAASSKEAACAAAQGAERIAELLSHGAMRTTSLIIGGAIGLASANPVIGLPLGVLIGFGVSYALDKPGHAIGRLAGHVAGGAAGRIAHATK